MKKNIKRIPLMALSFAIFAASCQNQPLTQEQQTINDLKNRTIVVPSVDQGAISGVVSLGAGTTTATSTANTQIQVRVFKDGKVLQNVNANENGQFIISNLPPGEATVVVNNKQATIEKKVNVVAGKVTSLGTLSFGSGDQRTSVVRNIEGKVVRADGTPIANARVADVTGGFISNFVFTNNTGDFVLPITSDTKARNLEISSENLTTSISVSPDQIENFTIPLIANSRVVKGKITDSVIKDKNVSDVMIKVSGTQIATTTDAEGNFTLRGVPLTGVSLEIGSVEGYLNRTFNIAQASTSDEVNLETIALQPIGNLQVNLVADNSICAGRSRLNAIPCDLDETSGVNIVPAVSQTGDATYWISNNYIILEEITGSIQIEGTQIVQEFSYPATPTIEPKPKHYIGPDESEEKTVYTNNIQISVPVKGIPGGEYTLTVVLPNHETQKGIKVVVPSNDTISTELIQMRWVSRVQTVGDVVGRVVIKDRNGVVQSTEGLNIRIAAVRGDLNLEDPAIVAQILRGSAGASSSGDYHLTNVPSGSRTIIAGVMEGDNLHPGYLYSTYSLLNIVGGQINRAPDMTISKR